MYAIRSYYAHFVIDNRDHEISGCRMLFQRTFRRQDPFDPRIVAGRLIKGPTEGLEDRLDDVVQVLSVGQVDVDIGAGVVTEGDEKLLDQFGIEVTDFNLRDIDVEDQQRPSYNFV